MATSQAQAESRRAVSVNGTVRTHVPAAVKALVGASYVFSATVVIPYNGCVLTFEQGPAYQIDAALLAYLSANGAAPTAQ